MKVATSILSADFTNFKKEIKSLNKSDYLHIDVMDGHFVPNLSFGYPVLKNLKKITNVPLDTHLMVTDPIDYIDDFVKLGSEIITIHVEANKPLKTIKYIKSQGVKAGISLRPKTEIKELQPYLELVDLILIMTVEPGFGGQKFMESQIEKIKYLDQLRIENNYNYVIEVDGGVNDQTIGKLKNTGVDIVVSGSYVLNQKNRSKAIESLK